MLLRLARRTTPADLVTVRVEETLEMLTWSQLGIHSKPVGLLNVAGYYEPLLRLVDQAVALGFVSPEHRRLLTVADEPGTLLERMGHPVVLAGPG